MKIDFIQIKTQLEIKIIYPLIDSIWREVFIPIIGKDQVDYMLRFYHSPEIIGEEILKDTFYYSVIVDSVTVGYLAFELQDNSTFFISKLYLRKDMRGQGIFTAMLNFLEQQAVITNKKTLHLHVNRKNKRAVDVYAHKGFKIVNEIDTEMGNGFYFNDYWMEKVVNMEVP